MPTFFLPIQIIFALFILFAASRVILRFKDGEIHLGALIFWLIVWTGATLAVIFPDKTSQLAKLLGIGRGADIIIYLSLALLFYLVFRQNVLIENLETKISQLIREITLQDAKKDSQKK